jgi:hypothetical protein
MAPVDSLLVTAVGVDNRRLPEVEAVAAGNRLGVVEGAGFASISSFQL